MVTYEASKVEQHCGIVKGGSWDEKYDGGNGEQIG